MSSDIQHVVHTVVCFEVVQGFSFFLCFAGKLFELFLGSEG